MIDVERLLAAMITWDGVPFAHQGRSRAGVDCLGVLLAALEEQGVIIDAPANYHWSSAGEILLAGIRASPLVERADPPVVRGDVLVFRVRRKPQHMAVALGEDRMFHVARQACCVTFSPLWQERLEFQFRWV